MAFVSAEARNNAEPLGGQSFVHDGFTEPLNAIAAAAARRLKARRISAGRIAAAVRLADLFGLTALGVVILFTYVARIDGGVGLQYILPVVLAPAATVLLAGLFKSYDARALPRVVTRIGRMAGIWSAVFGCFTLAAFFLKVSEDYSRLWLGAWFFGGIAMIAVSRTIFGRLVAEWMRSGLLERRALLVGGGPEAVDLIRALRAEPGSDIRICGIFDDRDGNRLPALMEGYPRLGEISELVAFGRRVEIDMLIVALPLTAERRLVELLEKLWVLPVDIRLSATASKIRFRPRAYSFVGAVPFLDLFDKPIADWDAIAKRLFDVVVASAALLVLSPVILAAMIAIRLDSPGPVLFRQRRYGFNNEVIDVLKLRSMHHHLADYAAKTVVTRNDPRVTRVGRFIRRTSIDELPQLINVIRGELSLVGPRPHAVNAHTGNQPWEQIVDGYFARHRVKPGVTGWAQVNGWRGEVDSADKIRRRVEHDLYYIENWTVLLDVYILLLTPFRLFGSENAY